MGILALLPTKKIVQCGLNSGKDGRTPLENSGMRGTPGSAAKERRGGACDRHVHSLENHADPQLF